MPISAGFGGPLGKLQAIQFRCRCHGYRSVGSWYTMLSDRTRVCLSQKQLWPVFAAEV